MKSIITLMLVIFFLPVSAQSTTQVVKENAKEITSSLKDGTTTVYGDSKVAVQTVYEDGKQIVKYLEPKTLKMLERVAKQLETTSVKVWDILVDQQRVWSIGYLIGMIMCGLSWINFNRIFRTAQSRANDDGSWIAKDVWMFCIFLMASITLSILSAIHIMPMLTGFFNPEYGALKTIAEIAQNIK